MAKRKNGKKEKEDIDIKKTGGLQEETMSWILAIVFFILFIFFSLGALGKAGVVGSYVFKILSILFGLGYYLIPLLLLSLSISSAMSVKKSFGTTKLIGAFTFFASSLALLELALENRGGFVGGILEKPLVRLFDVYASAIILTGIAIIGIITMFDTPNILGLFRRRKDEEEEKEEDMNIKGVVESLPPKEVVPQPVIRGNDQNKKETDEKKNLDDIKMTKSNISFKQFIPPPLSLLERDKGKPEVGDIKANANIIKRTLQNFGIIVEMDEISIGPSVTRYSLKPAEGVKLSKILGLQNNLELALAAHPVRIEAPIPGKSLVGIEIPNTVKTTVGMASILSNSEYSESEKALMVALGKGISGSAQFANLAKMPHLLIAGATGSGKSVTIHAIINSLLFRNSPETLKFIMIDPKRVELTLYNKIPHLLTPVITDPKKAIMSLKWAAKEMDRRYNILESSRVRDIESYHKNILSPAMERIKKEKSGEAPELMPYIIVVIDELADIMQSYPRELEAAIVRLAQMSRAVGIHLILSTQRPSVNVITGLIKANIPTRIALQVASQFDSRTILDSAGAEKLLGAGDMLYLSGEMSKPVRLQSPYISETEVKRVAEYLANTNEDIPPSEINLGGETSSGPNAIFDSNSDNEDVDDDLYEEARETVIRAGKASTSFLQRKLRIGYARAARLIDILEEKGVIGAGEGAKPREVLIKPEGGFATDDITTDAERENDSI